MEKKYIYILFSHSKPLTFTVLCFGLHSLWGPILFILHSASLWTYTVHASWVISMAIQLTMDPFFLCRPDSGYPYNYICTLWVLEDPDIYHLLCSGAFLSCDWFYFIPIMAVRKDTCFESCDQFVLSTNKDNHCCVYIKNMFYLYIYIYDSKCQFGHFKLLISTKRAINEL